MNYSISRLIEVCLSPVLFPFRKAKEDALVVVVDILRATTSMITAFDYTISFNKVEALPVYDTQKGWLYNDITE